MSISTIRTGVVMVPAVIWFGAKIPKIMPMIQLIIEAAVETARKAIHSEASKVIPERKTQSTLTMISRASDGRRLPMENSSPFTEEVIRVRSVCFSFSSASRAATQ